MSGHKNALKLLGCILETLFPTPVFKFPMNGNLLEKLSTNPTILSWKIRLKIANEIALVITYLHTAFPRPILHYNIYPENIHLDQDLCAKLSDFMLCMALPEGETQVENEPIMGTPFSLAPEIVLLGVYLEKSDVFGFGLILFNLLMGKANSELLLEGYSFMDLIQSYIRNRGINGIVDPTILAEG